MLEYMYVPPYDHRSLTYINLTFMHSVQDVFYMNPAFMNIDGEQHYYSLAGHFFQNHPLPPKFKGNGGPLKIKVYQIGGLPWM